MHWVALMHVMAYGILNRNAGIVLFVQNNNKQICIR